MAVSKIQLSQDTAFDRFLGASIGDDGRGINVTVVSMLARLDIDPWKEALELTAMPDDQARKRLVSLVSRFKDVPTLVANQDKLATDLVALLPKQKSNVRTTTIGGSMQSLIPPFGTPNFWIMAAMLFLCWIAIKSFSK